MCHRLMNLPRANGGSCGASFFCLPAVLLREGEGVPAWSATTPARLDALGSPTARLVLRGLLVVARRTQRTETRPRVRITHTPSDERAARLGGSGRQPSRSCCTTRTTDARTSSALRMRSHLTPHPLAVVVPRCCSASLACLMQRPLVVSSGQPGTEQGGRGFRGMGYLRIHAGSQRCPGVVPIGPSRT